jgi:hypothetical protein
VREREIIRNGIPTGVQCVSGADSFYYLTANRWSGGGWKRFWASTCDEMLTRELIMRAGLEERERCIFGKTVVRTWKDGRMRDSHRLVFNTLIMFFIDFPPSLSLSPCLARRDRIAVFH